MPEESQNLSSTSSLGTNLGRYLTSEIFELMAGGGVSFFVNKDVLTSQSQRLLEATAGPWGESTERKIDLKAWDSDTVTRLVEFLYIRDYTYPDPRPLTPNLTLQQEQGSGDSTANPFETDPEPDLSRPITPPEGWLDVPQQSPQCIPPLTDAERLAQFAPIEHDFGHVLLAHSKVYALANRQGITVLRTLARNRLHLVLARLHPLTPGSHITTNIVNFATHVYQNTGMFSRSDQPLRKLISRYIALNIVVFHADQRAAELVRDGGDFAHDLLGNMCRRLVDPAEFEGSATRPEKRYISYLLAKYPAEGVPPVGHITEVNGLSHTISWPDHRPLWLVPVYTLDPAEACTTFSTSASTTGPNVYLKHVRDQAVLQKITELALFRTSATNGVALSAIKPFDRIGPSLEKWTNHGQLYLVWKTAE